MLEPVDRSQIKTTPLAQATTAFGGYCAATKTAIHAIRALGAILVAAGIGSIIAGFQAPAIAFLVVGIAALIFGFILDKSEEVKSVLQHENLEEVKNGLTSELDESEKVNAALQPEFFPEIKEGPTPTTSFGLHESAQINPVLQPEILEEIKDDPIPAIAFGRQAWKRYIGDPGEMPPLPADIDDILAQPCPFWGPEKKIAETHMLVLIPKTLIVGDNPAVPLTLRTFMELLQSSNKGVLTIDDFTGQRSYILEMHGDKPIEESHWILMTKNILDGTVEKPYAIQKQLIEEKGYEVPNVLHAAIAILLENMRSETRVFERMFTRCQEHFPLNLSFLTVPDTILVGGFIKGYLNPRERVPDVLQITHNFQDGPCYGMAGMKKL